MYVALAFASALFAGATSILGKIGVRDVDSHVVTAVRTAVVLVFAWALVLLTGAQEGLTRISGRSLLFLALSGASTGASWLCYFRALQLGDVNRVAAVDKCSTVLTMLLAALLLGEPLTGWKLPALLLIGLGALLMARRAQGEAPAGRGWLFYAALSAVFAALTSVLGKIGVEDVDSNLATALRTAVVLAAAWGMVWVTGKQGEVRRMRGRSLLFTVLSGVATGVSWLCYYRALQLGPASVVAPIDKLSLPVTALFARLFLGERLSRRALLGLALLVGGTLLLLI